ncbi:MAG: hypothetical protein MJZ25_03740 [Fibrobacter sp.]|nr:hypothetical protein [Fibrobacter sp.]
MSTEIDPSQFFNIDFTEGSAPAPATQSEPNVFEGIESQLQLPLGSTKDALNSAKQLVAATKTLSAQADALQFKDTSFDEIEADEINDDVLRQDRARIRHEAHELYDMGKNMLQFMYDQLKTTITPGDKMWAAVANMITSVTNSLANLNKMTKDFREENDRDIEKKIQSGEIGNNDAQEMDMTPDKINKLIAGWTAANEKNINEQVRATAEANERKLLENKQ